MLLELSQRRFFPEGFEKAFYIGMHTSIKAGLGQHIYKAMELEEGKVYYKTLIGKEYYSSNLDLKDYLVEDEIIAYITK